MRYAVPRTRRALVPRRRTLQVLQEWRSRRVIAVVAPTGYGKTTLISEWLHTLPPADRPRIAWWSLQDADDAPETFLRGLLECLRTALDAPAALDELIAAAAAGRISPRQVVQMLAAELDGRSPLLLVLDDLHLLTNAEVHELIRTLVDDGPPALHLVFLSRTPPAFPLVRQRLSGSLLSFGAGDLAFDHHEFLEFVRSCALSRCSAQLLADIERRSEGWIAGLQMFAIAGEEGAPLLAAGTFVPEFLQLEVLRRMPPDLVDMLCRSSVLPWLDATSLASVLELPLRAAAEEMQRIQHTDLLAQTFAAAPQSTDVAVRLHPLLREHLLARLQRSMPAEEMQRLCERAAVAVAGRGDIDSALTLLPADPFARARLLAGVSRDALRRNERVALRRWLSTVSDDALVTQPQLALDAAWLSYMSEAGDQNERLALARRAVSAAADASNAPAHDRHVFDEWRAELFALEGMLAVLDRRPDDAVAAFQHACETPHRPDGLAEAYRLQLSVSSMRSISAQEKEQAIRRSGEILRRIGFAAQSVESMLMHALLLWQIPDVPRALLAVQEAAALTDFEKLELSSSSAYLYYIRGEMLYYLDRIQEARQSLLRSLHVGRSIGEPQSTDYWAHMLLQLCDHAASAARVDEAGAGSAATAEANEASAENGENGENAAEVEAREERIRLDADRSFMPFITARNAWLRIRRDAARGRITHIRATLGSLGTPPAQLNAERNENLWFAVLNAEAYVGENPAVVETQLRLFIEHMTQQERFWSVVHARTILAVLYARTGRAADARAQVAVLLPILERNRCPRALLEYPDLLPFIAADPSLFAQSMLQRIAPVAASDLRPFDLSEREIEILRALVLGRDTKEISHDMHIALATLRGHVNSIYHKMGVHSRAEAVRAARAVGIGNRE